MPSGRPRTQARETLTPGRPDARDGEVTGAAVVVGKGGSGEGGGGVVGVWGLVATSTGCRTKS